MLPKRVPFFRLSETNDGVRDAMYHIRKIIALTKQYLEDEEALIDLSEFVNEVICYVEAYPDKFDCVQNVAETALTVKLARLIVDHIKQHYLL